MKDDPALIGACDPVGAMNSLGTHITPRPYDIHNIVLAVYLAQLRALTPKTGIAAGETNDIPDYHFVEAVLLYTRQVRFQLYQSKIADTVEHIDTPVVIEEQGMVVQGRGK
jgi:hypothetical protein